MSQQKRIKRLSIIADLLRNNEVHDQGSLLRLLKDQHISITQGTLSNYLTELGATKVLRPGSFKPCYQLPTRAQGNTITEQHTGLISPTVGFRSCAFSGSLLVIRTDAGFAQSIAAILDSSASPLVLGSVAGYDTIIVVLTESAPRAEVIDWLHLIIPESILSIGRGR